MDNLKVADVQEYKYQASINEMNFEAVEHQTTLKTEFRSSETFGKVQNDANSKEESKD